MNIFYRKTNPISASPPHWRRSRTIRAVFSLLLLSGFFGNLSAQDIHFTQFYNHPQLINPGLTGVFGGNTRFIASYRSQWKSVPVDYQTFAGSVDHKFFGKEAHPGYFSGGLSFFYDRAGYSRLTYLSLGLNGSYTRKLTNHFFATIGVQGNASQRNFDLGDLTFDNQYDPEQGQANPNLGNGENFFDNTNNNFFDLSAGINFRWQALSNAALVDRLSQRSKIDVGIGIFHLNRPNQSFVEDVDAPLSYRISPYVSGVLQLSKSFDLVGSAAFQIQVPYNEYLTSLGARLHLNRQLGKQLAVQLGVMMRYHEIADAYSPALEVHYNNWSFGFSYDVNVSEFNVATNRRSGPEFHLRYIIKRVKPLPTFKICPLI